MPKDCVRFIKFGLAGAAGFAVDAGMLAILLKTTALDVFSARIAAIGVALCVTWLINRTVTFGRSSHSFGGEAIRYGGVGVAGSVLNYAIYSAVLLAAPRTEPFIALCLASAAVMAFSYFGYSRLVFQAK
jgi:putative flippase GtrA